MLSNKELKKLHETEIEILDEIDNFCKKNNIKYFLLGGTLLGTIRHKGFIPWDDDLDIGMFREDYEKFIKCYSSEEHEKYYVQSYQTDKKYWHMFAKLRKKNTIFNEKRYEKLDVAKEIFVDIFPIDNATDKGYDKIKIRANLIKIFNSADMVKLKMKTISECNFKIITLISCILPHSILTKLQYKLMTKDMNKNYDYSVSYCSAYAVRKEYTQKSKFFPLLEGEFEGKKYPIPNHYDEYLTNLYGDYMKLPPKEKRINHNVINVCFDTTTGGKDE